QRSNYSVSRPGEVRRAVRALTPHIKDIDREGEATMKFVAEGSRRISGFWSATPGSVLIGILEDLVPGEPRPFYVVRAEGDQQAEILTRDNERRACVDGDRVGISAYAELRGLARFKQHRVQIKCTGDRIVRSGRSMRTFDVEVSEELVDTEATKSAR